MLQVPREVDPSALRASISEGVLTLSIPLPRARKPHRIEISDSDSVEAIEARAEEGSAAAEPVAENNGHRELAGTPT